ncbi:MAG: hypothetical protein PHC60_04960 [Heliobacteriaceae bacterium]|nr:hypothetical protein [Heliobacteriaceae bacterium]MDD4587721.1 hypothetical protein [Heliobacteriaceae bacterium]
MAKRDKANPKARKPKADTADRIEAASELCPNACAGEQNSSKEQ